VSAAGGFSVYGRMTAQPGRREALIAHFRDVLRAGVSGLEWCSISEVIDDPDAIWMAQVWTDKAAHDTWTRSAPVVSATARVMSLLAGPPQGSYGQVAYLHAAA